MERVGLFSPSDEAEDVSTTDLKFLMVPYYLAQLSQRLQVSESRNRESVISTASSLHLQFLATTERLGLRNDNNSRGAGISEYDGDDAAGGTGVAGGSPGYPCRAAVTSSE